MGMAISVQFLNGVKSMKILMVTPFYHPIIGGTESQIENLAINLNKMGISTDVMTFNVDQSWKPWSISHIRKGKIEKINGINVIKIPALTFLPTRILFGVNFIPGKFLDKLRDYDIIHFHNDVDLSFPLFSHFVDKPKVFHCHCLHLTYGQYMKNPLDKCILKKIANVFVVQSNYFLKLLVNLGIPKSKIKIVLNGIDVEKFKPSSDLKIENLILFVGRLDPKKGLPVLLKALEYLRTKVHLIIIGPPSRPWFFKYCLSLIDKVSKNTIHKVTYLGTCSQEKLIKWYQKASVLVCPSLSELFPMVILEALSCATPVIATNVGAIPEIVKNYENGILVPPRNAMRLSEAIQYLLDNRKIRLKFGEDGRKFVFKNFSSKVVTEKLVEIYMDLLKVQFA